MFQVERLPPAALLRLRKIDPTKEQLPLGLGEGDELVPALRPLVDGALESLLDQAHPARVVAKYSEQITVSIAEDVVVATGRLAAELGLDDGVQAVEAQPEVGDRRENEDLGVGTDGKHGGFSAGSARAGQATPGGTRRHAQARATRQGVIVTLIPAVTAATRSSADSTGSPASPGDCRRQNVKFAGLIAISQQKSAADSPLSAKSAIRSDFSSCVKVRRTHATLSLLTGTVDVNGLVPRIIMSRCYLHTRENCPHAIASRHA